uniref:Membrane insertase YidC/Oxa/ALB C-terminal domain-containing protein n=1 Tax=Pseudonaja textilis TaxID=8673 RepID=A0A670Z0A4_PSETE
MRQLSGCGWPGCGGPEVSRWGCMLQLHPAGGYQPNISSSLWVDRALTFSRMAPWALCLTPLVYILFCLFQVVQDAANAPVETILPLEEISQIAEESTLAELGLGSFSPVGLIMKILESLHLDMGLPWWGAIVGGTLLARCLVFPIIVKCQQQAVNLNNHYPQMSEMNSRISNARKSGNQKEFLKAYTELNQYQKAHNLNPKVGFLMPIFISFFFALRKMAECPVPSMQTGGILWFTDLTTSDPYYALPLLTTASMLAVLELGAETGVSNPSYHMMKTIFRVMPILLLPITINFPTAIFTYWLTSNLYSLGQVLLLRLPSVRTFFRIPKQQVHKPAEGETQKGMIDNLKDGERE